MSIVLGYIKAKIQVYSSYKPPFLIQSSIRDSSLWIPYSIHWIPDFQLILTVSGILDSMSWNPIPRPRNQDSTCYFFFVFTIQNPNTFTWAEYKGETFSSSLRKVLWNVMIPASQFLTNEFYFQPDYDFVTNSVRTFFLATSKHRQARFCLLLSIYWCSCFIYR